MSFLWTGVSMLGREELVALISPEFEGLGVELVEVQIASGKKRTLRVFVDREGGVNISEGAQLSRRISRRLDGLEHSPGDYILEVSSAGMNRPIWTEAHFRRFAGERVQVEVKEPVEGQTHLQAVIEGVGGDKIRLRLPGKDADPGLLELSVDEIEAARLDMDPWKGRR